MVNATLLPLHAAHMSFGFFPGLLFTIVAVILIIKLLKHGRLGPVRFDPRRTGTPEADTREGPGRRPGPPWTHGFGPGSGFGWGQPSPEEAALATLADRLATGEISPEEYLERSTALRGAAGNQEG